MLLVAPAIISPMTLTSLTAFAMNFIGDGSTSCSVQLPKEVMP